MAHDHDLGVVSVYSSVGGDGDMPGLSQPIAQADIEDLLYDTYHPVEERIELLKELKEDLEARMNADRGEEFGGLVMEIEAALAELQSRSTVSASASSAGLDPADRNEMTHEIDEAEQDD